MSNFKPQKILVVRNDKLGDFVLSLPVFRFLKQTLPDCTLHALVPRYTSDIARACPDIDDIIFDPGPKATLAEQLRLWRTLRQQHYSAVITLFSTTRIGLLAWLAGIGYRLAPATKLAQIFYNHRIKQRRSRSAKPEFAYNLDLARHYVAERGIQNTFDPVGPFLHFPQHAVSTRKKQFLAQQEITSDAELIIIHPGSGGSANNLSLDQYAELAQQLRLAPQHRIVITAGPGEQDKAEMLSARISDVPHAIFFSQEGLLAFAEFMQNAILFIGGSTGPLHIAGALDIPTAGFYPRRRSATALRWQTLNTEAKRLAFTPPDTAEQQDMQSIDIRAAAQRISDKFL